jgi:adenylate cyclase
MYGNIGSKDRLDFTVISATVNETCRLESLCKPLATPLVLSAAFASQLDRDDLVELGAQALKGVSEPVRVLTLAALPRSARGRGAP